MRNGQNDIVGLMDNSGAVMVSYSYDSWGKSLTVSGTLATTLGQDNPFRYRGYHYDTETGLYYLQTRYYDATVCRFISADEYLTTGQGIVGNNTYVYCLNNSVCSHDDLGAIAIADDLLIGGALLLVTLFATTCFAVSQNADIPIATSFSLDNLVARAKESIKQTQLVVSSLFVGVVLASKPINLPAARKVTINSDHIKNNHTNKSNGGPQKDKFPDTMKLVAIERTIRAAYKVAEKIQSQGDRVLLRGNGNGMTIIMWLNKVTKIIETAWPKFKG
ncbi:MAG TPA: RHS repeat-associated core domain-containing protein [Clostridia bacterium]|nr:RHS repeat-associated core domain-containing protein [Clostridia bacterium]